MDTTAGYSSVGRASDCRVLQQSDGPWFDSGWPDFLKMGVFKVAPLASIFYHTAATSICCTSSCARKEWATDGGGGTTAQILPTPGRHSQATTRTTHRD